MADESADEIIDDPERPDDTDETDDTDEAGSRGLIPLGAEVDWPDHEAAEAVRARVAAVAGGRGRLGELAIWLAGLRGADAGELARVRLVVVGGEHANDDTVEPGADTATWLAGVAAGTTGPGLVAELGGVGVRTVPVKGADNPIDTGDAAPESDIVAAVAEGARVADEEADGGADLLVVAAEGRGVGTPAAALVAVLTNTEPVKVLPRGASVAPDTWMRRASVVRDARRRGFGLRTEPDRLLAAVGGRELAFTAGLLLQAAVRRTPVIVDGLGAAAAALVAYEAQPRAVRWWQPADRLRDPAHELILTRMGLDAVLDLAAPAGDGTGGVLTVPVLRAALRSF